MMRHHIEVHPEVPREQIEWSFEGIRFHRTAFERQVEEACLIKWSRGDHEIQNCNQKMEYNRCIVPELGDPDAPTPKEVRRSEETTEKILEWRRKRKSLPNEKLTIKRKSFMGSATNTSAKRKHQEMDVVVTRPNKRIRREEEIHQEEEET